MTHESAPSTGENDLPFLVAELQRQLATLERRVGEQTHTITELQAENELLNTVIDQMPYAIYWKDENLIYKGCNQLFASDLGLDTPAAIKGKTDYDLPWQPGEATVFEAIDRRILVNKTADYNNENVVYADGTQEWFETYKIPLFDSAGTMLGVLATYNNITQRKQAEATIQAQAMLLQELSTPIIPLTDQILVVPLVGAMDSVRAQQMVGTILHQLAISQARVIILDITGVPIIDTDVAQKLIQTGQAVQLLGARLVLTGIRPEVAQALVGLGVDLPTMVTYGTLQRAVAEVFANRGNTSIAKKT